jgi:hypothetical protein
VVALACRRHQNKRTSTGKGIAATNFDRWKEQKLKNLRRPDISIYGNEGDGTRLTRTSF